MTPKQRKDLEADLATIPPMEPQVIREGDCSGGDARTRPNSRGAKLDRACWRWGWLAMIVVILFFLWGYFGCVEGGKITPMADKIEKVSQDLSAFKVEASGHWEAEAGRDINSPWTSRILAASVPLCFLGYTLSHRVPVFRWAKDKLRGA
jgi:hypothetical protein